MQSAVAGQLYRADLHQQTFLHEEGSYHHVQSLSVHGNTRFMCEESCLDIS